MTRAESSEPFLADPRPTHGADFRCGYARRVKSQGMGGGGCAAGQACAECRRSAASAELCSILDAARRRGRLAARPGRRVRALQRPTPNCCQDYRRRCVWGDPIRTGRGGNRNVSARADPGGGNSGAGGSHRRFRARLAWAFAWPHQARRSAAGKPIRSAVPDLRPAPDRRGPAAPASSAKAWQCACRARKTRSGRHRARSKDQEYLPRLLAMSIGAPAVILHQPRRRVANG
jgi:hypothetical protein